MQDSCRNMRPPRRLARRSVSSVRIDVPHAKRNANRSLSMTVQGAHDAMERANVKAASAEPTPAGQADVILELSSAAQALVSSS